MYQALYRTYRPKSFDEVLGQEHIVRILKNQLASDSVSHAYLFCGTRGTGKTTMARLLAKGLNCTAEGGRPCGRCENCRSIQEGTYLDVTEMDAASNNGVDDIRALKESVLYPPALGKKKVYIIDEVHMLSGPAFNALLKTLEEPPEYVVFILATTEPSRLPQTVLSRCLRLDFRRVSESAILTGMKRICDELGIGVDEDALRMIAVKADGSVRDGLSILDQCLSGGGDFVSREEVMECLGTVGHEAFLELTDCITAGRPDKALLLLQSFLDEGRDIRRLMSDFLEHYRGLLIVKFIEKPEDILGLSSENIARLAAQSEKLSLDEINAGITEISKAVADAKWSTQPRILFELCLIKLCGARGGKREDDAVISARKEATSPTPAAPAAPAGKAEKKAESAADKFDGSVRAADAEESKKQETKEEKAPEASAAQAPAEMPAQSVDIDTDKLWESVCDEAGLSSLRRSVRLTEIGENSFSLEVSGKLAAKRLAEAGRDIEELLSKRLGRSVKMKLSDGGAAEINRAEVEETARRAEELLGVKVSIES